MNKTSIEKLTEEDFYEKDEKLFFKKRKCPLCKKDSVIETVGNDFVVLSCADHPNWTHFLVNDLSFLFK